MNRKTLWVIIVNSVIGAALIVATALCLNKAEWYLQAAAYASVIVFTVGALIAYFLKKDSIVKTLFLLNVVALIIIGSLAILNICGIFDSLSDMEKIKALILSCGNWSYVIFALINILNVVVLPLPGFVCYLAGVAVFGSVNAFIVTYISTLIGSVIAFYIGRIAGKRAVIWCIGEESCEKYIKMIGNKGHVLFVLMQILPFFPDDILCMVAGVTDMKFPFFAVCMILIRPIYIATVCFMGTGSVIPFTGWGIPVWIAIFAVIAVLFILYCRYQKQIEAWLDKITHKKRSEKDEDKQE